MANETSMTFRLPADLQAAFVSACKGRDRTAAQELRAFMREYVERHGDGSAVASVKGSSA